MTAGADSSRVDELSALAVPGWVQGVWRRTLIRTGDIEPEALEVVWIQTPTLYADIRWPARDDARAEGFAGWLGVEDRVCRWRRPVDLHPGPEDVDQGAMFREDERLVEVGLLANYLEEYRLLDPATRCFAASRGAFSVADGTARFAPDGPLEILVAAGPYVTHAARRDGVSALRHGRRDLDSRHVEFRVNVGDTAVFAGGTGTWVVWSDAPAERGSLLLAAES